MASNLSQSNSAAGNGKSHSAVLGLGASSLYYKWQPLAGAAARRDIRHWAAGAIDPSLPVPVEDCRLHCAPLDGGIAIFAIEETTLASAMSAFRECNGRGCECAIPRPAAMWDWASGVAAAKAGDTPLVLLDAGADGWTLLAGKAARGGGGALLALSAPPQGDTAAVARSARILATHMGDAPLLALVGDGISDVLVETLAHACGATSTLDLRGNAPSTDGLLARYRRLRYFRRDAPILEAEGASMRRRRRMDALLAPAALALSAATLAIAAAVHAQAAGDALCAVDSEIDTAAARLAGAPMRLHGPAVIQAARGAFAERAEAPILKQLGEHPREALRTALAFADARSLAITAIDYADGLMTFALRPEDDDDIAALASALERDGRSVSTVADGAGVFRLEVRPREER